MEKSKRENFKCHIILRISCDRGTVGEQINLIDRCLDAGFLQDSINGEGECAEEKDERIGRPKVLSCVVEEM